MAWKLESQFPLRTICASLYIATCIGLDLDELEKHGVILVCNALFRPSPEKYTSNQLFEVYFRLQLNMTHKLPAR